MYCKNQERQNNFFFFAISPDYFEKFEAINQIIYGNHNDTIDFFVELQWTPICYLIKIVS